MNNLQTEEIEEGTRCWKGYEKKGMKTCSENVSLTVLKKKK